MHDLQLQNLCSKMNVTAIF